MQRNTRKRSGTSTTCCPAGNGVWFPPLILILGRASHLNDLNPTELELEVSSGAIATGSHVAIYLTEENGQVNIDIEYQKRAYAEGSMKKFLNLYVEKFRQLVKG